MVRGGPPEKPGVRIQDGLKWERPDIKGGTNKILDRNPDSWTVVRDWRETDPSKKFKMFFRTPDGKRDFRAEAYVSADGVNWKFAGFGGYCGDRSTLIYNPFRDKWIYSLRWGGAGGRVRAYLEADDFLEGIPWRGRARTGSTGMTTANLSE